MNSYEFLYLAPYCLFYMRWIREQFPLNPYPDSTPAIAYRFFLDWFATRYVFMEKGGEFLVPHPYKEGVWKWVYIAPEFELSNFSVAFWDSTDYRFNLLTGNGFEDVTYNETYLPLPWKPKPGCTPPNPVLKKKPPVGPLPSAYSYLSLQAYSDKTMLAIRAQFPVYDLTVGSTPAIALKSFLDWYIENQSRFQKGGAFWMPDPYVVGFWKLVNVPKIKQLVLQNGGGWCRLLYSSCMAKKIIVEDRNGKIHDVAFGHTPLCIRQRSTSSTSPNKAVRFSDEDDGGSTKNKKKTGWTWPRHRDMT